MKRTFVALLGASLAALAAIGGLLLLMARLSAPTPPTPLPVASGVLPPPPPEVTAAGGTSHEALVASVDDTPITFADWQTATQLDGVMSRLAGQPIPSADETFERLINEILLLRGAGLGQASVDPGEAEARLASLEAGWGLADAEVVRALEAAGLTRQALAERVARLILVEQAMGILSAQHADLDTWLAQARGAAEISLYQPLETALRQAQGHSSPTAQPLPTATPAPVEEVASQPLSSPTASLPTPTHGLPAAPQPHAAPDFTLDGAQGGSVSLSDYRDKSAVVLVFYRGQT